MNLRDITKPVTAKALNESLAKQFGVKIKLEDFSLDKLQDVRNKLRTTLSQIETNESFDKVHTDTYQKNKLFLDVLNAEIAERSSISEKESAKPDFLDLDGDGDKEEPMKKAAKDKKSKGIKAMIDAGNKKADAEANESVVREGKEDEAELVMAAKDMVDRVTGWMEDTAEMQTESMLELADAIRDEMGQAKSEEFTATVKPALEAMYATMETTRGSLTQGVGMLTGEAEPVTPMGDDDDMGMEPMDDMDVEIEPEEDEADDFATADAGIGGEEEAGRARRESVERVRRLGTILSSR